MSWKFSYLIFFDFKKWNAVTKFPLFFWDFTLFLWGNSEKVVLRALASVFDSIFMRYGQKHFGKSSFLHSTVTSSQLFLRYWIGSEQVLNAEAAEKNPVKKLRGHKNEYKKKAFHTNFDKCHLLQFLWKVFTIWAKVGPQNFFMWFFCWFGRKMASS